MKRKLLALVLIGAVLLGAASASSAASVSRIAPSSTGIGILPPAVPAANCTAGSDQRSTLAEIDYCRATEGVGPLTLPRNFAHLTVPEQLLALINLERLDRGLPADIGLNSTLNSYAQQGAANNTDPSFPPGDIRRAQRIAHIYDDGGSIWAEASMALEADLDWMYDDGPGSFNEACPSRGAAGCWGHRGIILSDQGSTPLVGGGGYAPSTGGYFHSFAFEQLYGYSSQLVWAWHGELASFAVAPALERETVPVIRRASPAVIPAAGGRTVTVTGAELIGTTAVMFGAAQGTDLFCATETRCTVKAPAHARGQVSLTARDPAGVSRTAVTVTY